MYRQSTRQLICRHTDCWYAGRRANEQISNSNQWPRKLTACVCVCVCVCENCDCWHWNSKWLPLMNYDGTVCTAFNTPYSWVDNCHFKLYFSLYYRYSQTEILCYWHLKHLQLDVRFQGMTTTRYGEMIDIKGVGGFDGRSRYVQKLPQSLRT